MFNVNQGSVLGFLALTVLSAPVGTQTSSLIFFIRPYFFIFLEKLSIRTFVCLQKHTHACFYEVRPRIHEFLLLEMRVHAPVLEHSHLYHFLHAFLKSFYLERFVSWSVWFLSCQFLSLEFNYSVSLVFWILFCFENFWPRFSFVSFMIYVWTHKTSYRGSWLFWSFETEYCFQSLCQAWLLVYLLCFPSFLWPSTYSCFSKVSFWWIWKCFYPDFLVSFSKLFFFFWIIECKLKPFFGSSFHSCWIGNLQSFLVLCFRSSSLWWHFGCFWKVFFIASWKRKVLKKHFFCFLLPNLILVSLVLWKWIVIFRDFPCLFGGKFVTCILFKHLSWLI